MSEYTLKSLLTLSLEIPEAEEENEDKIDKEQLAERQYRYLELLESINTEDFKHIYNLFINDIRNDPQSEQQDFCREICDKIKEIYEYEISLDRYDVDEVFTFIEFIEFNHIEFLTDVWNILNINIAKLNISEYTLNNLQLILKTVDEMVETHYLIDIIKNFLLTIDKDIFIQWFIRSSEKNKIDIIGNIELEKLKMNNKIKLV